MIDLIGRAPAGPLLNQARGGQGIQGWNHSEETKRAMSEYRRGKPHPGMRGRAPWNKGAPQSEERKAKTAMSWTEERRSAQSARSKGKQPPLEACIRGGLATKGIKKGPSKLRGIPRTAAHRAAISAARSGKPHPHKGVPRSPETRAKISATKRRLAAASAALAA
jgi:hypothetical protein